MREEIKNLVKEISEINDITLKNEIVVLGSTYMKNFPFYELVNKCRLEHAVYNRSMEGLTLDEVGEVLQPVVLDIKPSKVFLCFGENETDIEKAQAKYKEIIHKIRKELPNVEIYVVQLPDKSLLKFNEKAEELCDNKEVIGIKLLDKGDSRVERYKQQFKQLSRYFRDKKITLTDIYAVVNL
ncbi:MAG: hypothetical protein IJW43_05380 [Clostridia bacterium]|nr:hypothetical protein [Clostridia bacterium]